ncbi:MAG: glycosyltransferase family 4 protein [Acidobacteria bacterium]|nr:glycosyltransferase family 4 protein [Acidobacteriota bacterium]
MTKLLLVISEAFRSHGGIQQYNRLLCKAVSDYAEHTGARVQIVSRNDENLDSVNSYIHGSGVRFRGYDTDLRRFVKGVLRASVQLRPDITLLGLVNFSPIGPILRLLGLTQRFGVALYGVEAWRVLPPLQRWALGRADFALAISEYTRGMTVSLNRVSQDRIYILHPALDPFWPKSSTSCPPPRGGSKGRYSLLTVARLDASEKYKGTDQVIRALPQVISEAGDLSYVVVGDGDDRPRLERLAQTVNISDKVQFLGHVAPDVLRRLYAECDLFIMPSLKEGFGIVFLEAMSCGKACIGGCHGGTPEVVVEGQTGLLVDYHDSQGLTKAICRLLQDSETRDRMGKAGQARLHDQFMYPSFRSRFADILES